MNGGRYENGDRVWPRYHHILIPPSGHNDANVEAQHEGERDQIAVLVAVCHYSLEDLLLLVVQYQSVDTRKRIIYEEEEGQVQPDQLVYAGSPSDEQINNNIMNDRLMRIFLN